MSQSMVAPGFSDLADVDELVSISMLETTIVVRLTRRPDPLGTQVLTDVVNASNATGATVMLHRRDALVDSSVAIGVLPANVVEPDEPEPDEPEMAEPGGTGLLNVRSGSAVWTIDFGAGRFVRSERPVDRLLLTGADWTAFDVLWITPTLVRALTSDGCYLSGRRTLRHPCTASARDDRQEVLSPSRIA